MSVFSSFSDSWSWRFSPAFRKTAQYALFPNSADSHGFSIDASSNTAIR
ncbi:unnamed protein product [Larinioides sclopetarius]|uniref:Uncharacterized protein n=1 Tax=Larinioides sclopetarius TaxID=280406 RepID=A0AAV1ZBU6_9ARAC